MHLSVSVHSLSQLLFTVCVQKSLSYTMHLMLAVMLINCVLEVVEKALNAEKVVQQLRGGETISF
jgi:hypothetical protein